VSTDPKADVGQLRSALRPIEREARTLPWAGSPGDGDTWTTRDYVRVEAGLAVVDLHDLDRRLALDVVAVILSQRGDLGPKVRLITGRGLHSKGGKGVLRAAVIDALRAAGVAHDAAAPGHVDVQLSALATPSLWTQLRRMMLGLLRLLMPGRRR
jgi:Smr domain